MCLGSCIYSGKCLRWMAERGRPANRKPRVVTTFNLQFDSSGCLPALWDTLTPAVRPWRLHHSAPWRGNRSTSPSGQTHTNWQRSAASFWLQSLGQSLLKQKQTYGLFNEEAEPLQHVYAPFMTPPRNGSPPIKDAPAVLLQLLTFRAAPTTSPSQW